MRCGLSFIILASLCFHHVLSVPLAQKDPSPESKATGSDPKPDSTGESATGNKSIPASEDASLATEAKDVKSPPPPAITSQEQQQQSEIQSQGQGIPRWALPASLLASIGLGGVVWEKPLRTQLRNYIVGFDPTEMQMDRLKELIPKSHPMYAAIETCVRDLLIADHLTDLTTPSTASSSSSTSFNTRFNPFRKHTKPEPPKPKHTLQSAYDQCIRTQPDCRVTDPYIIHYPDKHVEGGCAATDRGIKTIDAKYTKESGDFSRRKYQRHVAGKNRVGDAGRRRRRVVVVVGDDDRNRNRNRNRDRDRDRGDERVEDVARGVHERFRDVFMMTTQHHGSSQGSKQGQEYALGSGSGAGTGAGSGSLVNFKNAGNAVKGFVKGIGASRMMMMRLPIP